jgi:hypothetical protein
LVKGWPDGSMSSSGGPSSCSHHAGTPSTSASACTPSGDVETIDSLVIDVLEHPYQSLCCGGRNVGPQALQGLFSCHPGAKAGKTLTRVWTTTDTSRMRKSRFLSGSSKR